MDLLKSRKPMIISEIRIAITGANGCGKSALTVKLMTRRFISIYDPNLEDTYCKKAQFDGQEISIWIMDTVNQPEKDPMRYISWADAIFVLYSITDKESFEYAEQLMKRIGQHDHSNCLSSHTVFLIGNKTDLDRYRVVTPTQGMTLATIYKAKFFEINVTEEYSVVKPLFKEAVSEVLVTRKKAAQNFAGGGGGGGGDGGAGEGRPWLAGGSGVEEMVGRGGSAGAGGSGASGECQLPATKTSLRLPKTNSMKSNEAIKFKPSPAFVQKKSSGLKLLKLFQEKYRDVS